MNQSRRGFFGSLAAVSAIAAGVKAIANAPETTVDELSKEQVLAKALEYNPPHRHLAWFAVPTEFMKQLMPPGFVYDLPNGVGHDCFDWLHSALLLPETTHIDAVSTCHRFMYDEVSIRVEDPALPEVPPGVCLTQVRPQYLVDTVSGKAKFVGWDGMSILAEWQWESAVITPNELRAFRGLPQSDDLTEVL